MLAIHPQARTTPAVRAEIARSPESSGVLAKRYGVSSETIRKWRKRGPDACQDRSARPHKLPWRASDEERAIVCALRRSTGFPLDALTFVVSHFLPHLNRDAVYRILKAEGLNRLPPSEQARKPHGTFKDYEVGFVHVDVKHLPKLQDRDRVSRKRYLYVAIDRASRYVHLAVKDDETTASAIAFLTDALGAFPFQVTHVLTDRGSCFTADAFEAACERHGGQHRKTRPYTPKTNGMVERFNGRVQREVLGITLYSHNDLEIVLRGFNAAYNGRRQRVLNGLSPEMVLRQRLEAEPALANPTYKPPSPSIIKRALCVVADAKEVSQPDMLSDAQWSLLEPMVEACRPHAKKPPEHLRRTISAIIWRHENGAKWRSVPPDLGPWWMAAQTFIRWARLEVWQRLLTLAQERSVQLGMTFLDGTNIRAHQKAAGAAKKGTLKLNGTYVKRLAALVAASAPRPASSPTA